MRSGSKSARAQACRSAPTLHRRSAVRCIQLSAGHARGGQPEAHGAVLGRRRHQPVGFRERDRVDARLRGASDAQPPQQTRQAPRAPPRRHGAPSHATRAEWPAKRYARRLGLKFQTRTSPSAPPDMSCRMLGLNTRLHTAPRWPRNARSRHGSPPNCGSELEACGVSHWGVRERAAAPHAPRRLPRPRRPPCRPARTRARPTRHDGRRSVCYVLLGALTTQRSLRPSERFARGSARRATVILTRLTTRLSCVLGRRSRRP